MSGQLPLWEEATPGRRERIPLLSKSRFAAGLQCHKRLYLECYHRDLIDPLSPGRKALLDAGTRVGLVARNRWPGLWIEEDYLHHDQAVERTARALQDPSVPAIHEAAFTFEGVRVRVDVLARHERGEWDLIEVKSSASVKEEYLPDVAVQLYVVEGSGVRVRRTGLLHINSRYVYPGGPYDLERLFQWRDQTQAARERRPQIVESLASMRESLRATAPPDIPPGIQCERPYRCPFYSHCHADGPEHPIDNLPRAGLRLLGVLRALQIRDIRDIPDDFDGLSELQQRVRDCVRTGTVFADPELRQRLRSLTYPVHFLDFETCNPALPLYPGTRPFQQIPFQWSNHAILKSGSVTHQEFLHDAKADPRLPLAEALAAALADAGTVVVYSGFEERIIRLLADEFPSLAPRLLPLVEERMVDLLELIRRHYYHPGFRGSFSIKDVLPALVPGIGYKDLAIREGGQAGAAFVEMTDPATPAVRRAEIREALRAYCRRDTEAMVLLFQALKEEP
jgi:CRISPR/Cas system-associated exonuclease Cas4 (RecB family)